MWDLSPDIRDLTKCAMGFVGRSKRQNNIYILTTWGHFVTMYRNPWKETQLNFANFGEIFPKEKKGVFIYFYLLSYSFKI